MSPSGHPVLLLMDYQEAICRETGPIGSSGSGHEVVRRGCLPAATVVLASFRRAGATVIHIRVGFDDHYVRLTSASARFESIRKQHLLLDSDPLSKICAEVAPEEGEIVITKGCVNPFVGTHLAQTLLRLGPTELVLGGVQTNHVVESTARFAADTGYKVVVLEDLCAGATAELHDFAITRILPAYATVMKSADYLAALNA